MIVDELLQQGLEWAMVYSFGDVNQADIIFGFGRGLRRRRLAFSRLLFRV